MSSKPNWLDLPSDVAANILLRLGPIAILQNAHRVCTTWYNICKDPSMWRVIDMQDSGKFYDMPYDLNKMCKHAVKRSQGQLLEINIEYFGDIKLLHYIANRSSKLRYLRLSCLYHTVCEGLSKVLQKLPALEELSLSLTSISNEAIEVAGLYCPLLKTLKINGRGYELYSDEYVPVIFNEQPLAIARSFPELLHLQLIGNNMNNLGLEAILDGCPHLESLDLRRCPNIRLAGDLGIRRCHQIKYLRLPRDSIEDYKFNANVYYPCMSCGIWNDLDISTSQFLTAKDDDYDDLSNFGSENLPNYEDLTNYDEDFTKLEESNNCDEFPESEDWVDWENFKMAFEMSYKIKVKEKKGHFRKVLSKRRRKAIRKVVSKWKRNAILEQLSTKKKERIRGHFRKSIIEHES